MRCASASLSAHATGLGLRHSGCAGARCGHKRAVGGRRARGLPIALHIGRRPPTACGGRAGIAGCRGGLRRASPVRCAVVGCDSGRRGVALSVAPRRVGLRAGVSVALRCGGCDRRGYPLGGALDGRRWAQPSASAVSHCHLCLP